ncbi:MAG: nucleotide exchange factor GrpE [Clostridia bacterium]|nr:nucleotide exchange factor GrpE [Clostridia bacterium]
MTDEKVINEEAIFEEDQAAKEEVIEPAQTTNVESEVSEETVNKEEEDLRTKYLRLAADFQNFKRRSEKEKSDVYAYANERIVVDLLDVIDNFERAMEHKCEAEETKVMEGMEMILKQLRDVLEKNHLEEINALSQAFDPAYHHAVMEEAKESAESGTVIKVLQKGYMLNKKVIRPAMVVVSQ